MRSIRRAAELAALGLVLAGACACSNRLEPPIGQSRNSPPVRGGRLTVASFVGVRSIDPAVAFDEGADPIQRLLFARLVRLSRDGTFEGELAESFHTSDDGRQVTFRLRPGALFHDGSEVTAADIKRSLQRTLHQKTPCPAPSFFDRIEGYQQWHDGTAGELAGIQVLSDSVVRFALREPDATFLAVMTLPMAAPVCRSAGELFDPSFSTHACGAGPYKLRQWDEQERLLLDRHDGYVERARPYLDGITWLLGVPTIAQRFRFERGELDLLHDLSMADSFAFRSEPAWQPLGSWTSPRLTKGLFMNVQMPPFDRLEVRRAVAAAIDRDAVAKLRGGFIVPADRMVPAGVLGHDASFPGQRFDLQAALGYMQQAGMPFDPATGRGGYPETIDYLAPADSFDLQFAELVQQQLARIGIRIRLKSLSWPAYLAQIGRRNTVRMGAAGWTADFDDPSDFFEPILSSKAIQDEDSQNYAFFSDAELDALIERGRRETLPAKRNEIYRRAEEIVREQAPWAVAYGYRRYEVQQGYVRGYQAHPHAQQDIGMVWLDHEQRRAGAARAQPPLSMTALASALRGGLR
jgi:ABC-type transport system substrate-binding protein